MELSKNDVIDEFIQLRKKVKELSARANEVERLLDILYDDLEKIFEKTN